MTVDLDKIATELLEELLKVTLTLEGKHQYANGMMDGVREYHARIIKAAGGSSQPSGQAKEAGDTGTAGTEAGTDPSPGTGTGSTEVN